VLYNSFIDIQMRERERERERVGVELLRVNFDAKEKFSKIFDTINVLQKLSKELI
jgi:hypothetical protein